MIRRVVLSFLFLVGVTLLTPASLFPSPPRETPLQKIQHHAGRHNLDWHLVLAIILVESEGNPRARSRRGARGLMQVMPIHRPQNPEELYDLDTNLSLGCAYLSEMIRIFGFNGGIQAYNIGGTAFHRSRRAPRYLRNVLKTSRKIKSLSPPSR